MRCAAIDFGTNTARLLIGERCSDGLEYLHVERDIVRMGGDFTLEHGLSVLAQQRGLKCLARFADIIREYGATQVRATATSAVREAVNGQLFVDTVERETGIRLNVISGDFEGRLTLKGVISGLDTNIHKIMVLDVGGGSTEVTMAENGDPLFVYSMPIGVVKLTEECRSIRLMEQRISTEFEKLMTAISSTGIDVIQDTVMVATAGTATTLAAISLGMTDYDYRLVNNYQIHRDEIAEIYQRLLPMEPHERLSVAGLEKGREDLIISGIQITLHAMNLFGHDILRISDYGLLEGIALADEWN